MATQAHPRVVLGSPAPAKDPAARPVAQRLGLVALLAVPGLATAGLAFDSGGYFAGATALVAALAILALAVRVVVARAPLGGWSRGTTAIAVLLAAFAVWTLASPAWSEAALGRTLVEYSRVLLYLFVFAACATVARTPRRFGAALTGVAGAAALVCFAALLTRTLPETFTVAPNVLNSRLSWPVGYWNALGLIAALGIILGAALATAPGPILRRVFGALIVPVLAATLVLTFSRGGLAVAIGGLLVYVAVGRPPALLGALVAIGPATVIVVREALDAQALAQADTTTPAAIAQGHHLIIVVAIAAGVAALVRAVLSPADDALRDAVRPRVGVVARRVLLGGTILAVVAAALALGAVGEVRHQGRGFLNDAPLGSSRGPLRDRLTASTSHQRVLFWRAALHASEGHRLAGLGAGSFSDVWVQRRPRPISTRPLIQVQDAHSLYVETLAELGIVGLGLLVAVLLALALRLAWLARGPDRAIYAAALAALAAWAVHAGIDWDWEVPATTAWLFGLGGLAWARAPGAVGVPRRATVTRVATVLVCAVAVAVPLQLALSQRSLDEALRARQAGRCADALAPARRAAHLLGPRSEPFEIQGVCLAQTGHLAAAERSLDAAVKRSPSWDVRYELAVVRARRGHNPEPALATAARLNPYNPLVRRARRALADRRPAVRRRRARDLVMPGPGVPR